MSKRCYESGAQKRAKQVRKSAELNRLAGSLDKFFKRGESSSISNTNLIEICNSNSMSQLENNVEENVNEPQLQNIDDNQSENVDDESGTNCVNIDDILSDNISEISNNPQIDSSTLSAKFKYDILDPATWPVEIYNKQRMFLVEQSPKCIEGIHYKRNSQGRCFSDAFFIGK